MNGFMLAIISIQRRPVSSCLAVVALLIPLVIGGLSGTLVQSMYDAFENYDSSVDAILAPKSPDLQLILSSLYGVGWVDRIIPYGLLNHARKPMKKRSMSIPAVSVTDREVEEIVIKQATPMMEFADYRGYKVIGTDETFLQRPDSQHTSPKLAIGEWADSAGKVVIGSVVAQQENLQIDATVFARSRLLHPSTTRPLWQKQLTVVGILEPTGYAYDRMLFTSTHEPFELYQTAVPLNLMRETRNLAGMSYALLWVHDGQEKRIQDHFDNYTVGKVVFVQEQMAFIKQLLGGGGMLGNLVLMIAIVLGVLCVMILFNARFETMGEDLAILRTLGYGKIQVAMWLIWESVFLWALAIPLALLVEWGLVNLLYLIPGISMFYLELQWPTAYHPWLWGVLLVGCYLALLIPLIRLYLHRLDDTLKGM